jgi:hypothetical protein
MQHQLEANSIAGPKRIRPSFKTRSSLALCTGSPRLKCSILNSVVSALVSTNVPLTASFLT